MYKFIHSKISVIKAIETKQKLYCGIDVSGATLDVCYQTAEGSLEWCKCANNAEGFKEIWQHTGKDYQFVMESTGVYQLPFCFFLEAKKAGYSVVNALQIKRYIQMKLERNKSDKKDAFHISACMAWNMILLAMKCPASFTLSAVH